MKNKIYAVVVALLLSGIAQAQKLNIKNTFKDAERQTDVMLAEISKVKNDSEALVSPRTVEKGRLRLVRSSDWTSGFFPGELWRLYAYSKNIKWRRLAEKFTANIEKEQFNGRTHDMGFKVYCSVGNGYLLTKNDHYRQVLIQSAKTLSTRFNKTAGVIRSWDHNKDKWAYPVIIDNMLNLELLFEAAKLTGDSTYYNMAVSHANKTMENHFRKDYSSYHVVDYDSNTGKVLKKTTHQGYSDESAWARGQAWGLYGYTMCYRETKDPKYLQQAQHIAGFIFNHPNLPEDLIPYWDFNAPGIPNEPRDVSAAAVMASALLELSSYSTNGQYYKSLAGKILSNLTKAYRAAVGKNYGFILLHSTGSKPSDSEVDVPLAYADYYYLEALLRVQRLSEGKKLF
ncbi:AGE family epimerase/isomerase [Arachidicoccus terrestris]|uniref:glycoside hydrolase family 88 protein n=1 Tax=Arachidicoccus terrestris TaxID=2875539 RepID=UPI001CC66656|nr:glycoside hydrolase family 88 protein [Arachidicoccus terrestris]UAY54176.1 glycoside hydrolase family 88 protein [Arachidicoccus terrestris]